MATVIPPPSKRQKTAAATKARLQHAPESIPEGAVRIRFVDRASNETIGPTVSVPLSQSSVKNLEILANSLSGASEAADRVPYRFFHEHHNKDGNLEETALADSADIYSALVKTGLANTEDELVLALSPQAVFKVKAVSRCASSIAGHGQPILTAQFSPASSSQMVTGAGDNAARIWDCETGTPLRTLQGHSGWVLCASYSPDNTVSPCLKIHLCYADFFV